MAEILHAEFPDRTGVHDLVQDTEEKAVTLGLTQRDGTVSGGDVMFRRNWISSPTLEQTGSGGRIIYQTMETRLNGARGTVLQRYNLYEGAPMGETIRLEIGNLWQYADLKGNDTGLGVGALYEAVANFPAVGPTPLRGSPCTMKRVRARTLPVSAAWDPTAE